MSDEKPALRPIARVVALGECAECGQIHDRCKAHRRLARTDGILTPCRAPAMKGGYVCRSHGGAAQQSRVAAKKRLDDDRRLAELGRVIAEAEAKVAAMGGTEQLHAAITTAGAMALTYRWLLDALPTEATYTYQDLRLKSGGMQRVVDVTEPGLLTPDPTGRMRLHPFEEAFRHWTKQHGELLRTAATIGLEERRQALASEQVDRVGQAIMEIVKGLGRRIDDPAVVPVVEGALRTLTSEVAS